MGVDQRRFAGGDHQGYSSEMRMPGKAPATEPVWEAMAEELNPRGEMYRLGSKEFPPGEWVEVTAEGAERLRWFGWAQIRERID